MGIGAVEGIIGFIGVVVPEPNTTAGGVLLLIHGGNGFLEGGTQIMNANNGQGYNAMMLGFTKIGGYAGDLFGNREAGETTGSFLYLANALVSSTYGSYKVLKVPGRPFFRAGVGGQPGGLEVGRLQMLYKFGRLPGPKGTTILNIMNNEGKWFLRINTKVGQGISLNGRIIGLKKWHEVKDVKEILEVMIKLTLNGATK